MKKSKYYNISQRLNTIQDLTTHECTRLQ